MVKAKKRKKTKTGAIVFAVFMIVWALALAGAVFFGLTLLHKFGEYWEASQINPKVEAYMNRLSQEIWDENKENSIVGMIGELEHPYQSDEECEAAVKEMLQDDLRCVPAIGVMEQGVKKYDLRCGRITLGQITVRQYPFEPEENSILNYFIEKYDLYPWEVDSQAEYTLDDIKTLEGLYTDFEITVPASYSVVLNGHKLTEENIIQRDIPFNCLKEYYDDPSLEAYTDISRGLPSKVTYHADKILGHVDYQVLDEKGELSQIDMMDPNLDDSVFIEPISQTLMDRFADFTPQFTRRYLQFCSGAGEMYSEFNVLKHYMVKDSELYDRLYKMIESYLGWQHNSNFNFNGATLNGATALGNNIYILDVSADAGSQMPSGYKQEHRDMKIYVLHDPPTNELFAFSVRDYGNEGAVNIG